MTSIAVKETGSVGEPGSTTGSTEQGELSVPKRDLDEYFYAFDEEVHGATKNLKLPPLAVQKPRSTKQGEIPRDLEEYFFAFDEEIHGKIKNLKLPSFASEGPGSTKQGEIPRDLDEHFLDEEVHGVTKSLKRDLLRRKSNIRDLKFGTPEWKLGDCIGAGAFGKVYKCFYHSNFADPCAVKVVKIEPHHDETRTEVDVLKNEISILSKFEHRRILTYYGSEEKENYLYLFIEFMERGSLYDYIKERKFLDEGESRKFTRQMLEGVSFLHSENVTHRDIKGSNVLIDLHGDIKLADFGLSKLIQKIGSKTNFVSYCGTPHWMAPEILLGEGYGRKVDIWSLGCTVVEMLTGSPPLGHLEPVAAMFKIGSEPTEPTLPEDVSQNGRDFIKATLTWDPKERPSADELLQHRFLKNPR